MSGLEPTQKDIASGKGNNREQETRSNHFYKVHELYSNHRPIAGEMGEHEI